MNTLKNINSCIVIPCYNEENRLPLQEYCNFITENPKVMLCLVNDGSSDKTKEILEELKRKFLKQVTIISYTKNVGKAEAVRKGILYCNNTYNYSYIGYLDADLSTSLQECVALISSLNENINFVFGSRIMKIGSIIIRNRYRFLVGRIIATVISNMLKLKVYDTQCGCKVFTKDLSVKLFEDQFISKWLFDVEIFYRMIDLYGREQMLEKTIETPLKEWIDKDDSKVKTTYFFKLCVDLYRIKKKYRIIRNKKYLNVQTQNA
ncbi:MAG: glycosyltransferase [Flavobacteriaceae bacterium]|nr:glycosyltransferase [Flavobacteriaceae bacterium]